MKPGNYRFQVRATDDLGLTTSSTNQGTLTINAQVPGDAPPDGKLTVTGTARVDSRCTSTSPARRPTTRASRRCQSALYDGDTSKYLQPNGTWATAFATRRPALGHAQRDRRRRSRCRSTCPRAATGASRRSPSTPPDQQDTSTSGATARYRIYPGDVPPILTEALLAPTEGTTFTDGRIFVSGRAEDDKAMQSVRGLHHGQRQAST